MIRSRNALICYFEHKLVRLALLLGIVWGSASLAQPVVLYDADGEMVPDYIDKIELLKASTPVEVDFGDGQVFKFEEFIGEGKNNLIFSIGGGRAIRINQPPKTPGRAIETNTLKTWKGMEKLKRFNVPMVKVFEDESPDPRKFLIVEELPASGMTFKEWLLEGKDDDGLKADSLKFQAFVSFVQQTAQLESISDFHAEQLYWNGEGWILIDWMSAFTQKAMGASSPTIWDGIAGRGEISESLHRRIKEMVRAIRRGETGSCLGVL